MQKELKYLEFLRETSSSIFPLAEDVMKDVVEKEFSGRPFYNLVFIATQVAPNPMSIDIFSKRNPYNNPEAMKERLEDAAQAGYFKGNGDGTYILTEQGVGAIDATNITFYGHINKVNKFPTDKLQELAGLLEKLVESSSKTKLKNDGFCLKIVRAGHPKVDSGSLAQVDQLIDVLLAFRDDAHISAWAVTGVDGHTWETFSFVWNGEANTAEKLMEKLPFRRYVEDDYKKTLLALTQRGWIQSGADGYVATDQGKKVREDVENATDENYFTPWKVLSERELVRMGELLEELTQLNKSMVEKKVE